MKYNLWSRNGEISSRRRDSVNMNPGCMNLTPSTPWEYFTCNFNLCRPVIISTEWYMRTVGVCCHRFSDEHQHIVHNEGGFSDAVVPWMSSRGCSSLQRHTRLVCWQRLLPRPRPRRLDPTKVIVLLYFFLNYMILYAIFVYYHFLPYFNNKYFNNKRTSSQQAWQRARSGRRSTNRDQQRSIALNCYSDPTWPWHVTNCDTNFVPFRRWDTCATLSLSNNQVNACPVLYISSGFGSAKLLKSVKIWQSCSQMYTLLHFMNHSKNLGFNFSR